MSKRVVKLARGKLGFFDPINRINLFYPTQISAAVPENATKEDLKYIIRGIKSGVIVDVNGVFVSYLTDDENVVVDEDQNKAPAENKPKDKPVVKPEDDKKEDEDKDTVIEEINLAGGKITVTEEPDEEEKDKKSDKKSKNTKKSKKKK